MEFIGPVLLLMFLVNKTVDWLRAVLPDSVEGKILIPLSMATGALFLLAFSATEWAEIMAIGDYTLAELNWIAVLLAGAGVGAGGSQLNDFKPNKLTSAQLDRAVDQADTLVVEGEELPKPLGETKKRTSTRRRPTP